MAIFINIITFLNLKSCINDGLITSTSRHPPTAHPSFPCFVQDTGQMDTNLILGTNRNTHTIINTDWDTTANQIIY